MLFVLFICIAIAVLAQTLSAVVICADRTRDAEVQGRRLMAEKDRALTGVRQELLSAWASRGWSTAAGGQQSVESAVADLPASGGRVLAATTRHTSAASPVAVSAWVERGSDGFDLPLAGLVAGSATWTAGRASPWFGVDDADTAGSDADGADGRPAGWFGTAPQEAVVGPDVTLGVLATPWRLDEGWRRLCEEQTAARADGLAPGSTACFLTGREGSAVRLPLGWGATADAPTLVVVTGGASLDATGRGDLYGVIVVDGGSVSLEGATVHGAVFATGTVDFGSRGEVRYSPTILRWATDRSLVRTRLVPGSRRETIQ